MGSALVELGRFGDAAFEFERAVELEKGRRNTRAYLARSYALGGRRAKAEKIFGELKGSALRGTGSPWGVALVAVSLGLNDEAMRWLDLGYQRRELSMGRLKVSPEFSGLRSDRRFVLLLEKMGL